MNLKINMGTLDRIVRFTLAILFGWLYFTKLDNFLGLTLMVLAVIFLITSLLSWCPLYQLFGVSTCKVDSEAGGE